MQKARDKVAAEEEAWHRGCRKERRRKERRRQYVLDVLDAGAKENNMVVRKNSKKKMDVAKEENGERLIK